MLMTTLDSVGNARKKARSGSFAPSTLITTNIVVSFVAALSTVLYCLNAWQRITAGWPSVWAQELLLGSYLVRDGRPLYYSLNQVPALTTMYTPFTYYLLLPITFIRRPDWALCAAALWCGIIYALPLLILLTNAWRAKLVSKPGIVLAAAVFASLTLYYTANAFCDVTPATLCVGIGGLAVLAATSAANRPSWRAESIVVILTAVAILTKQVMLPLMALYPLLILQERGLRASIYASLRMTAGTFLIIGIAFLVNNPRPMYLHTIWIPAHQGWSSVACLSTGICSSGGVAVALTQKIRTLCWLSMKLLIGFDYVFLWIAMVSVILWRTRSKGTPLLAGPFLLTAVLLIPTSLMNVAKLGGTFTNYLVCMYFFYMAASALALELEQEGIIGLSALRMRSVVLVFVALPLLVVTARFARNPELHTLSAANPDITSYELTRRSTRLFFPWYPLSTYLASGKVYHFPQAIMDRSVAGITPDEDFIRRGLPGNTALFAYHSKDEIAMDPLLHSCSVARTTDQLPGWTIFDCGGLINGGAKQQ